MTISGTNRNAEKNASLTLLTVLLLWKAAALRVGAAGAERREVGGDQGPHPHPVHMLADTLNKKE